MTTQIYQTPKDSLTMIAKADMYILTILLLT